MNVIPDGVLESVSCKQCCSYLTVGPIKDHPDGGHICGRCFYGEVLVLAVPLNAYHESYNSSNLSVQKIPAPLLLYACIPEIQVPCVNRFEGCRELMSFFRVRSHESQCRYNRKTKCLLCEFNGVGSQLVQHTKMVHKENYLCSDNPVFTLTVQKGLCRTYLYRSSEDILCWFKVEFTLSTKQLYNLSVKTSFLGNTGNITYCTTKLMFRVPYYLNGVFINDGHVLSSPSNILSIFSKCDVNMSLELPEFQHCEDKEITCIYTLILPKK